MENNEEMEASISKEKGWEVVSLTASTYDAAPGPNPVDLTQGSQYKSGGEEDAETSNAMLMSGHFVVPSSQNENLLSPLENSEKHTEHDVSELVEKEGGKSNVMDEENVNIEGLISEKISGEQLFDEVNILSVSRVDLVNDLVFGEKQSVYSTTESSLCHNVAITGKSSVVEDAGTDDSIGHLDHPVDSAFPDPQKPLEGDKYDDGGLPCEAWWKRRAISLYTHAKEADTIWSMFIAATVLGLVIIGHRWQFFANDERMGRMLGPISRFKDVIVGGHRRGSLLRGSISGER